MKSYRLTFITPLFSKGSYNNIPEIRASSIRGQLHWWFRALGGVAADENSIFGAVHSKPPLASKIVVRTANIQGSIGEEDTLPHKHGGQASPKWAYLPGTSCEVHLLERLGGLIGSHREALDRAMKAWLLLGSLGLRSTRGGGNFVWEPLSENGFSMPQTIADYVVQCEDVLKNTDVKFALLNRAFDSADQARRVVTDTLGGKEDRQSSNDLASLRYPLGRAFGGRKTSPLKFRIMEFGAESYIMAIWDGRFKVTGNQTSDLNGIIDCLIKKDKPIGRLLKSSSIV